MEQLLHLSVEQVALYTGFLIATTLCIVIVTKALGALFSKLHLQKLETKAGSVVFTSPHDRMSMRTQELDEPVCPSLEHADWGRHAYFNLLSNLKTKGVKVTCASNIKAQFINEYMKIYAATVYDELLKWVRLVVQTDGKELINITATMNKIEGVCQNTLRDSRVEIKYRDETLLLPMPKILIERFTAYYSFSQSAGFETLEMPLDSKFYNGWREELNCILAQLYTITSANFVGMNCAIKTLNGELDHYFGEYAHRLNKESLLYDYLKNET